jgi:hypothetical protein
MMQGHDFIKSTMGKHGGLQSFGAARERIDMSNVEICARHDRFPDG